MSTAGNGDRTLVLSTAQGLTPVVSRECPVMPQTVRGVETGDPADERLGRSANDYRSRIWFSRLIIADR